ncbi:MAG: hypothetical protein KGM44_11435 [bacterium]|nr:hypothetical protein [bacterium]
MVELYGRQKGGLGDGARRDALRARLATAKERVYAVFQDHLRTNDIPECETVKARLFTLARLDQMLAGTLPGGEGRGFVGRCEKLLSRWERLATPQLIEDLAQVPLPGFE